MTGLQSFPDFISKGQVRNMASSQNKRDSAREPSTPSDFRRQLPSSRHLFIASAGKMPAARVYVAR